MTTIGQRKADHLALCATEAVAFRTKSTLFDDVRLVHDALPDLDMDEIDTSQELLGKRLRAPLVIAAMTGGTEEAARINRELAAIAEERGYGFGLGSQRAMHLRAETRTTYTVRDVAPTTLILGNLGVVQAGTMSTASIEGLVKDVGADALCIHLNPAMELIQPGGDRDFSGGLDTIARLVREQSFPVVVKETGCGLSRAVGKRLASVGVRDLDVSGAGGTSWVGVETKRAEAAGDQRALSLGEALWDWGVPTAASVALLAPLGFRTLIATGGVSSGHDVARAVALGGTAAGVARPLLKALSAGGRKAALAFLDTLEAELRALMLLTGSRDLRALRSAPRVLGRELRAWLQQTRGAHRATRMQRRRNRNESLLPSSRHSPIPRSRLSDLPCDAAPDEHIDSESACTPFDRSSADSTHLVCFASRTRDLQKHEPSVARSPVSFSRAQFLDDIRTTAHALDAPFSEHVTRRALDTFADNFSDGATVWKTTERPGDHLCYRFFARTRNDTIAAALRAGALARETDCTRLMRYWTDAHPGASQSCDFDALNGLAKTWLYLGGMRPATKVLGHAFVPDALRGRLGVFHAARFDYLRFVAVDHRHSSANLYFRTRGPITAARLGEILDLVGALPPAAALADENRGFVPEDFCVAVTVSLRTGKLERACFYALDIPADRPPALPERISRFFAKAPCYDAHAVNVVGWSFGPSGGTYIKAERGYVGDMAALLTDWDCYFSGSTQKDVVLAAGAPSKKWTNDVAVAQKW
jgi:isopentenyl-diphosphate delta-isomerase